MPRTKWKGPFIKKNKRTGLKNTQDVIERNSKITPKLIGITFTIYNGKGFSKITVTEEMIGHKFGEFSPTRKTVLFRKK